MSIDSNPTTEKVFETALAEQTRAFVERGTGDGRRRPWQRWIDAELGLRGYWYPIAPASDLAEGGHKKVTVLGEEVLLLRHGGVLRGVEDRCAHRGTRLSERPLVLSEDTITCWYHTWTYDLDDGRLRCILNDPESVLTGKTGIRTYPLQEVKGIIWIYIGDGDPPPLTADVPPGFLDEDMAICVGPPKLVNCNWRLCLENGFDPGHHFIHNWSPWVLESGFPMTFGYVAKRGDEHGQVDYYVSEPGPKGFTRCTLTSELIFEATIPGKDGKPDTTFTSPGAVGRSAQELHDIFVNMPPILVGIWAPCSVSVENFPTGITYFDWGVPVDEHHTLFFPMGGKRVASEAEGERWVTTDGWREWYPVVPGFIEDDNMARRSMEKFYAEEDGWYNERLYRPDLEITMFRKFFSEHARDLQTRERALGRKARSATT